MKKSVKILAVVLSMAIISSVAAVSASAVESKLVGKTVVKTTGVSVTLDSTEGVNAGLLALTNNMSKAVLAGVSSKLGVSLKVRVIPNIVVNKLKIMIIKLKQTVKEAFSTKGGITKGDFISMLCEFEENLNGYMNSLYDPWDVAKGIAEPIYTSISNLKEEVNRCGDENIEKDYINKLLTSIPKPEYKSEIFHLINH